MKVFHVLVLVAVLISMSYAEEVLPAVMSSTYKNLIITNCKSPTGGPDMAQVSADLDNPMPVQMRISYQYLDLATGKYEKQPENTYCYIPPSSSRTCTFVIPIRYGGNGNGTLSNIELLRVTGSDVEEKYPKTYMVSFSFNIKHDESLQETNVLNKIASARGFLSQAASEIPCTGTVCCGMGGALDKASKAKLDIANSEEHLKLCNITGAYSFSTSAYSNAKGASSAISTNVDLCRQSLQDYKSAKTAVDEAESRISGMGCQVEQPASQSLAQAKSKLSNAAVLIGVDDYESAAIETENARAAASTAKNSAKCVSGNQGTEGATDGKQGNGGPEPGTGTGTTGNDQPPPLCPIGMALFALVGLGAFAYSTK